MAVGTQSSLRHWARHFFAPRSVPERPRSVAALASVVNKDKETITPIGNVSPVEDKGPKVNSDPEDQH